MELSDIQFDALREIINIGVGRSAASLNQFLNKRISLQVPDVEVLSYDQVKMRFSTMQNAKLSIVKMGFKGELTGLSELVFPTKGAAEIVRLIGDSSDGTDALDNQIKTNILTEIGNVILNALIGTLSNLLKTRMRYTIPQYFECEPNQLIDNNLTASNYVIYAETHFRVVNEDITGSFILFLEVGSFERLSTMLNFFINKARNV